MTMADKIKARRKELRLTQDDLAKAIGVNRVSVTNWESGKTAPSRDNLPDLAKALQVSPAYFFAEETVFAPPARTQASDIIPAIGVSIPRPSEMPQDLPVLGTAACSANEGAFQIETDVIEYVRRPHVLRGAAEAYGIYLTGDSMEPRYDQGELVIVHPKRPVRLGDHVILVVQRSTADPPHAFCKKLIRRRGGMIVVEQYNPRGEREFPENAVVSMHRIMEMSELLGI